MIARGLCCLANAEVDTCSTKLKVLGLNDVEIKRNFGLALQNCVRVCVNHQIVLNNTSISLKLVSLQLVQHLAQILVQCLVEEAE